MMRRTSVALALSFVALGCDEGAPASPTFQSLGLTDATVLPPEAGSEAGPVCPPDIDASFGSIYGQMLSTSSCGSGSSSCHSTAGASFSNLLDYSLDAGAVYAELLGQDGGGHRATNVAGDASVLRVVPFEAGASMLYIKLTLTTKTDPSYGAGMPLTAPGQVCPAVLDAVKTWIDNGAAPPP
ncbi:MAG TPA: hypothetical protein VIF09_13950 [Polyangiaceae bacterium]|jgi:hypothetical protein